MCDVIGWIHRYLWVDFGAQVWPNVAAVPFCAVLTVVATVWRVKVHLRNHHKSVVLGVRKELAEHRRLTGQAKAGKPRRTTAGSL